MFNLSPADSLTCAACCLFVAIVAAFYAIRNR